MAQMFERTPVRAQEVEMSTMGAVAIWGPMASGGIEVAAPAGTRSRAVRLTRRGRLVRSLVALAAALAMALAGVVHMSGAPARAGAGPSDPVAVERVSVEQGDSLWLIAERVAPERDPRDVVHRLRELNGLDSNLIQPGQVLLIPSGL
jgi:nucleoid-associated protein YgaU